MKKTVDVFIRDRLITSYPVVVTEIDQPTDEDYVDQVKRHMRRHHSRSDIAGKVRRSRHTGVAAGQIGLPARALGLWHQARV